MNNRAMKGIYLGAMYSCVAWLDGTMPRTYDNIYGDKCTPSAVWIDKRGNLVVGRKAREKAQDTPDDCQLEFKRLMGTDQVCTFASSGRCLTPVDLSAEVLKSLKGNVERSGDFLPTAVIGVPASFDESAAQATRKAAELAGIEYVVPVQEPVLAAMAFGFQNTAKRATWLVYDLGGGTFDASLVQLRDGRIEILNHIGEPYLGERTWTGL